MGEKSLAELVALDVDQYISELMLLEHSDEKIDKMLEYMKLQLSHGEIHPLSRFWKMRKFCLDNFKETILVSKRLRLWETYREVIDEIMKLKLIIDEKSAFEKEQIEEALLSIKNDLGQINVLIEKEIDISVPKCSILEKNAAFYKSSQRELSIYSSYAKRLNDLKKEILSLDISFKKKQEILDQIHVLADQVFPKKREVLTGVSKRYIDDIKFFVKTNFSSDDFNTPTFNLKEQIKQLQGFAKTLSLNVEAFSKTRQLLSECWDKIKNFESQQKKLREEKRQVSDQNFNELQKKIDEIKNKKEKIGKESFNNEIKSIDSSIENEDLLNFQKRQLRDKLDLVDEKAPTSPKPSEENNFFTHTPNEIQKIKENIKYWDYQTLDSKVKALLNEYTHSKIQETHPIKIERELFSLKEALFKKLIDEVKDRIDLEEVSLEIESFKVMLKQDMQLYRKVLSSSNQSIEKAIGYNELLTQAKELLKSVEKELSNYKAQV